MTSEAAGAPGAAGARKSGWAPLRTPGFRNLWTAQFVSNIGSWMQTVAAQWVMVSLTSSALLIGAIQSASSIPVLLLAVPSGVLGDLVDRRRLILATQVLMLLAAAVLALLSALHDLNPGILLGLLFVLGIGTAASAPTWQTLQPELVTPEDRPQAIALGSVNQNLARAIGPAIGGALLAATSAALVFGVNAVSFVAVLVAVFVTAVPKRVSSLPREHALDAARAGGRFVANSPRLLALIARSIAFILPAGSIWALLPLIARGRLHLGATGYGLLLGCVGVGAVVAATYGPTLRQLAPRLLYALSAAAVGVGALVLAVSSSVALDAVLLVLAGGAWITGIGLLGAAYQSEMPQWVKARGMSYYLVGFQGSNAIGGLAFGALASATTVRVAFLTMAGFLLVTVVGTWRLALPRAAGGQFEAASDAWPLPMVDADSDDADSLGPVMVNVEWHVDPAREDEFLGLAKALRGVRRRTGAISWRLYRRAEDSHMFVETFVLGSWAEHERQHARMDQRELAVFDQLEATVAEGEARPVEHLIAVRVSRRG